MTLHLFYWVVSARSYRYAAIVFSRMFKEAGRRSPGTQLTKVQIEISVRGRRTEADTPPPPHPGPSKFSDSVTSEEIHAIIIWLIRIDSLFKLNYRALLVFHAMQADLVTLAAVYSWLGLVAILDVSITNGFGSFRPFHLFALGRFALQVNSFAPHGWSFRLSLYFSKHSTTILIYNTHFLYAPYSWRRVVLPSLRVSHYKDAYAARNTGERVMQYHKINRWIESSTIVGSTLINLSRG